MTRAGARIVLWIGGARSGKSRLAQAQAEAIAGELVYVATGEPRDEEMTARIARHRKDRGTRWRTVEAPINLPDVIKVEAAPGRVLLVDCLTLWLSNLMLSEHDLPVATRQLIDALGEAQSPVLLVTNEVGMGIVPENALARRFRDEAGRLNQRVAEIATEVQLVAAGLALRLK